MRGGRDTAGRYGRRRRQDGEDEITEWREGDGNGADGRWGGVGVGLVVGRAAVRTAAEQGGRSAATEGI